MTTLMETNDYSNNEITGQLMICKIKNIDFKKGNVLGLHSKPLVAGLRNDDTNTWQKMRRGSVSHVSDLSVWKTAAPCDCYSWCLTDLSVTSGVEQLVASVALQTQLVPVFTQRGHLFSCRAEGQKGEVKGPRGAAFIHIKIASSLGLILQQTL